MGKKGMAREVDYLFVYGTLMAPLAHPMHETLRAYARFVERGCLPGSLYEIDGYPGMVDAVNDRVKGEIYEVADAAPLFEALDAYEGCTPRHPQPHEYRRDRRDAKGVSGRRYTVWVYLYNGAVSDDMKIETGDYRDYLATIGKVHAN
jgi:gamma-glutamylcyclotransferase (GGCT)/AIG2-like uncharacterized protein YtfP